MSTSKPRWDGDDRLPPLRLRVGEVVSMVPRLLRTFGSTRPMGPEDGPPVLVIPGFVAHDRTTFALRRALAEASWRVHGWEMGLNTGAKADTIERLRTRIESIAPRDKMLVVGWSLGGIFARELARAYPDRVSAVVTLGSPFSGDPKQNHVWRFYQLIARHRVDNPPIARITAKPPVPHLALWSRQDGLIAPRSARGLDGERDCEVELSCTHLGFGVSARAGREIVREIERFLEERGLGTGG